MERHTRGGLKLVLGLGVGIGLMVGAVAAAYLPRPGLTDDQVRERARVLGMLPATSLPPASAPAPVPKEAPPKTIVIYAVVEGMSFDQIAAMLKQTGVLPDAQALTNRARERNALEQVKAGVYTITLDPAKPVTPDQVIDQLLKGSS
jgi:hypothetical protein